MDKWEEIINKLPTDEQLRQMEKTGKLEEIDKEISNLQAQTEQMNERMNEREEMYNMLYKDNNDSQEQEPKITKR